MKKIILTFSLLLALSTLSFAQCGKKITLTSSKTEHLDANDSVKRAVDETSVVELSKTTIDVTVNGNHIISGTIKADTCNWKIPYKEGKSIIKALVNNEQGEQKDTTITIEGKGGKVTLLFEMDGMPDDRIRVIADKFEEKN